MLEPLQPKLFGFAFRMLRDEDRVKDAMQELNLKLWKKRKELKTNKNISAYCFQIMHNICIDEIRYAEKQRLSSSGLPFSPGQASLGQALQKQGMGSVIQEADFEKRELISRVRKVVDQLPGKQKAIIELHDFQELSHAEIAEILNMEVNAVRVNLSRARAKIVTQFKKEEIYG